MPEYILFCAVLVHHGALDTTTIINNIYYLLLFVIDSTCSLLFWRRKRVLARAVEVTSLGVIAQTENSD